MEDESRLVRQAQEGDMNAFRELIERHKKAVYYLAFDLTGNVHDAEDLSQETFIKMYQSLKAFRGDAALGTWLYRITVNRWMEISRTAKHRMTKNQESIDEMNALPYNQSAEPADSGAEAALLQTKISTLLGVLSANERSAFMLRHYHDHSIREIGKIMNLSTGTVKSMLFRAVRKLRDRFHENPGAPAKEDNR